MVLVGVGVFLLCGAAVGLELSSESHAPMPAALTRPQHDPPPVSLDIAIGGSVVSIGRTTTSVARGAQAEGTSAGFANSGILGFRRTTTAPHRAVIGTTGETNSTAGLVASRR